MPTRLPKTSRATRKLDELKHLADQHEGRLVAPADVSEVWLVAVIVVLVLLALALLALRLAG